MADKNKVTDRKIEAPHKLKTTKIIDLTGGQDTGFSVTITNQRRVINNSDMPYLKRMLKAAKDSPWKDNRLGEKFADKAMRTDTADSPTEALKSFLRALEKV